MQFSVMRILKETKDEFDGEIGKLSINISDSLAKLSRPFVPLLLPALSGEVI